MEDLIMTMQQRLKLSLYNIKGITNSYFQLPLDSGMFAIAGLNGCGKSSILAALSLILRKNYPPAFPYRADSRIEVEFSGKKDILCQKKDSVWWDKEDQSILFNGMYEGSLFYGTRFLDSGKIDELISQNKISENKMKPSHQYVKDNLSHILYGEPNHYPDLYQLIGKSEARKLGFKNIPYFYKYNEYYISQYKMSSGECLLISLLHFINNAINNKSLPEDQKILMLIDEIEVALHPSAVTRLFDLLNDLCNKNPNLTIYLTTHSPEVIKQMKPDHIFLLTREYDGMKQSIHVTNPCFPHYTIRNLHEPCGYDFILLVEDILAKKIVDKVIRDNNMGFSKLIKVLPVGGWKEVLQMHSNLQEYMVFPKSTHIYSILDGDIQEEASKQLKHLSKRFLPIPSLEKFLFKNLIQKDNFDFKKLVNDKYFSAKSIDSIITSFKTDHPDYNLSMNKSFFAKLIENLPKDMASDVFIDDISNDILSFFNIDTLKNMLDSILQ